MTKEQRRFIRPDSLHLVDYLIVDEQGQQREYSMGRTLNISQGGILIETQTRISPGMQVMITLELDNELIDIMGKVIHTTRKSKRHHNGIEFFHVGDDDKIILAGYIDNFNRQLEEPLSVAQVGDMP